MSTDRNIVLFDLFGVIARHQRPGAQGKMAARCPHLHRRLHHGVLVLPPALRRRSAVRARVLDRRTATAVPARRRRHHRGTAPHRHRQLVTRRRPDGRLRQSLRDVAEVALLSNIPSDHADAFLAAQPWLHHLDHVAFSGKIKAAKPAPAAFRHCVVAMRAAPTDFLFVDDREENVSAAQAMGMNGHVFTDPDELAAVINAWLPMPSAPLTPG